MEEVFKNHPVYKGYQVSNMGNVKGKRGGLMSPHDDNGYNTVSIRINYSVGNFTYKSRKVHRLVVETFVGPIPEELVVNHIDGDKKNNRLDNLEIVTHAYNSQHAYHNLLRLPQFGSKNGNAKIDECDVLNIYKLIKQGKTNGFIAEKFGLHERYVSLIRSGKRWKRLWDSHFSHSLKSLGNMRESDLDFAFMIKVIRDIQAGVDTNKGLGRKYGLDPSTISRIRNRKTWTRAFDYLEKSAETIEGTNQLSLF